MSCSVVLSIKKIESSYIPQRDTITETIMWVKIVQQQEQRLKNYIYILLSANEALILITE